MSKEIYAKNVKFLRKQHQMTQEDLAVKVGVKRGTVGSWEEGRATPEYDVYFKLCDVFRLKDDRRLFQIDLANLKISPNPGRPEPAGLRQPKALEKIIKIATDALYQSA